GQLSAELSTGGNPLAHVSGTIDADLLDDKASATGQQPGSYMVAANDTLARISQKVYGDSRYWYLLADANGLSPNEALTQGKMLVVPNQHTQTFNGAESFKPYNESEVLGNITPEPIAPPPPKKSCNPVAMIIMVAVAVVVTVYTAGAAAAAMSTMAGAAGAGAAGAATIGATGMAALAGGVGAGVSMSFGVAVAASAIGGAMGAAASQLVGMAMGEVDKFSWNQVALGGLASAAAAGVGGYLSGASAGAQGAAQGANAQAQSLTLMQRLGYSAVRSTAAYGTHYLGSKALGEDASFSWTNLAASVAGNMVGNELSLDLGHEMGNQFARGMVQSSVSSALRGESWRENAGRFALDAFGNALGNSISQSMSASSSATQRPISRPSPQGSRPSPQGSADDPTVIVTPLSEQDKPLQWDEENLHFGSANQGVAVDTQQEAQLQALFDDSDRPHVLNLTTIDTTSISVAGLNLLAAEKMAANGWGSYLGGYSSNSLLGGADTPVNLVEKQLGLGKYSAISLTPTMNTKLFADGFSIMGDYTTKLGMGVTTLNMYHKVDQNDYSISDVGKYAVDMTASATTLRNVGYLSRLNPIGVAYSVVDIAIQKFENYTVRYGNSAGENVSGWSALYYSGLDTQKDIGPTPPPSQWHLQGYLNERNNQ
ncbi:hypothetical protein GTG28_16585, partial [Vibrio sp. OCN044]